MSEEAPQEEPELYYEEPNLVVALGRMLGLIVIAGAIALGAKVATTVQGDQFWAFLNTSITPAALGFLVLFTAEILGRMGRR